MTLTLKASAAITGSYNNAKGLVSAAGSFSLGPSLSLANGTAAGQADGLFTASESYNAGEIATYGLSNGLVDLYGQDLDFTAIKILAITADPGNQQPLLIGGGTWDGCFGSAANIVSIRPGETKICMCTDANGYAVDPNNDGLVVTSAAAFVYTILIAGVSSSISAPAITVRPSIVGTPMVGVPTTALDGDWSGSPTLTYEWFVAGVLVGTGATYTPASADAGKALMRTTFASNAAGTVSAFTAAAIIAAASGSGTAGQFDFSNPAQSGLESIL